ALPAGATTVDTFRYRASDGVATSGNEATVAITVTGTNDAPFAVRDVYPTSEDMPLNVGPPGLMANDTDIDGDRITVNGFSGVSSRGAGLVVNSDGSFSYDPRGVAALQALGVGQTLADTFTYTITDGKGGTAATTVTVNVNGVNDPPVANNDNYRSDEDSLLVVSGQGVIANDSDADASDAIVVTTFDVTSAQGAPVTVNANGTFEYDPTGVAEIQSLRAGETQTDTFTYAVGDGKSQSNVATVTVTIGGINDAPTVVNDVYDVDEDGQLVVTANLGVLANDFDPEGSSVFSTVVDVPARGSLVLNSSGSFTYTPNPDFSGPETFTYRASDGSSSSNPATVTINVAPQNDEPVGVSDSYAVNQDTTLAVSAANGVLKNDLDVDGEPLRALRIVNSGPADGNLTLNEDGSFSYTPNEGFFGNDSFQYEARDAANTTSGPVTVSLEVQNTRPWRNAANNMDVNGDGVISPIDTLLVINFLNEFGSVDVPDPAPPGPPFRDVNGDNQVTPLDALLVINFLNSTGLAEGEGEGFVLFETGTPEDRGELDARRLSGASLDDGWQSGGHNVTAAEQRSATGLGNLLAVAPENRTDRGGVRFQAEATGTELDTAMIDSLVDEALKDTSLEELSEDRDEWLDALDQIFGAP
ncbi:MAG: Ig-like domain-containing protein, partial [Pirellulales bacterium]